ncbi:MULTISPECIES: DUF2157 domain-containing protein [unclassified Leptolyngbya]|uniref:DUF2157 domain-containing protein n=1 Tax=unclassified Leptolyngbya TaxID=2650499 RepID=UPI0016858FC3|nr:MULTISPECIES: DUF2157 domain-containing protein [unclassified Leptolyngbya]MBD1910417.1 DUF2157 domain-containing protein [Leptolyngbya sp. FACHB-8]MBD2154185.1 DUF2157 domain-containing protein [Leptolyngbya sp. FACHB-16]
MASEKFRRQLRQEAQQWQGGGLISPDQYEQLANLYQFERLETSARDRFIVTLIGLGSILLGLGVITFVAANWQAIPRSLKLTLLLTVFLGANILGYWLWTRPGVIPGRQSWQQRLGTGFLLLGGLLMGANLALGSQMFHIGGAAYQLFLVWGLGVLAMAFGLRLLSLSLLAMLLLGVGYWSGFIEPGNWSGSLGLTVLFQGMPLFAAFVYTWLAYRTRSRVVFALGAIALITSFFTAAADLAERFPDAPALWLTLVLILPPALLWSYDDYLWWSVVRQPLPQHRWFRSLAQGLAIVYLVAFTYLASFNWVWANTIDRPSLGLQLSYWFGAGYGLWLNPTILILILITLASWAYLARPTARVQRWGLVQSDITMLLLLGFLAFLVIWHVGVSPLGAVATFIINIILALFSIGFIREGLAEANRGLFWCGLVLLALHILSRMLEYDTGLLLKSLSFVLCGVGVILFGLWFERNVRSLERPSVLGPSSSEESIP